MSHDHPGRQPDPYGPPPRRGMSPGALIALAVGILVALLVALGVALAGAGEGDTDGKAPAPTRTTTRPPAATPSTEPTESTSPHPPSSRKPGKQARLPDFAGKGLQFAQDEAQSLGFRTLTSHDAFGRGRAQVLDRNWKVCSQTPAPGSHPTDVRVDFGTVKLDETCPATDTGTPPDTEPGGALQDFAGTSVKVARGALPSNVSLTVKDALGDRMVLLESHWKVCAQSPAAGTTLDGRPITLTAVKFEEKCP
ncbi:hypothetical protein ACIRQF_11855 [Streptomyces sp. NPDC101191]|uniref:hypothetical protein n=1 Tax=Streptomyces sp. NPDC101191 TaxID=3366126 RepID=UPI00380F44C5